MILLVDADYLAYRTAAACQVKIKWDDEIITQHIDMEDAKRVFADAIFDATEAAGFSDLDTDPDVFQVVLCWSCPTRRYHRHDIAADYKSNRHGAPPLGLADLREWASSEWVSYTRDGLEADDILGILGTKPSLLRSVLDIPDHKLGQQRIVIVGVDKDLLQIPGWHINPNDPERGLFHVSEERAHDQLCLQALTGDATDGYPGCPGMGPVKAQRWLDNHGYTLESVVLAYLKSGLSAEDAAVQINLARILSADAYDFKEKKPILWDPSAMSTSENRA